MSLEIISWSISMKVWDQAGIKPGPLDLQSDLQCYQLSYEARKIHIMIPYS